MQFLTAPFDKQYLQTLSPLFNMYHEVTLYFDNEQDSATIVINDTDDEDV